MRTTGSARHGLSLTEVLVACAILALVFIPVFRMFMSGVSTTQLTEDRLKAFAVAQRQIETIKHASTINRFSHGQLTVAHANAPGFQPFVVDDRYMVLTEIDPKHEVQAGGKKAFVCLVRVVVKWKIHGHDRELEIATMLDQSYR